MHLTVAVPGARLGGETRPPETAALLTGGEWVSYRGGVLPVKFRVAWNRSHYIC